MLVPDRDGNMADVILGYDDLAELSGKYTSFWCHQSAEMQTALEMQ